MSAVALGGDGRRVVATNGDLQRDYDPCDLAENHDERLERRLADQSEAFRCKAALQARERQLDARSARIDAQAREPLVACAETEHSAKELAARRRELEGPPQ